MNHHQEVRRLYKRSFWILKKKGSKIQNKKICTYCWLLRTADDKDTDPRCTLYDSWSRRHISWCPRAITRVLAEDTSATLFLQVIHHFRSGSVSHNNNNQRLIFLFLVDAVFPQASETPPIFCLRRNDNNIFCKILSNRVDDIVSGAISVKVNCESVSYTPLFKKSFSAISRNIITPQRCVAPGATSRALTEQIRTQQNTAEHSRTQQSTAEHSRT